MRAANALVRLRRCPVSPEPSLLACNVPKYHDLAAQGRLWPISNRTIIPSIVTIVRYEHR